MWVEQVKIMLCLLGCSLMSVVAAQEVNAPIQALLPITLIVEVIVRFNASLIGFKQPLQSRRSLHSPDELLNGANCLEDDDQLWIVRWRSGL